MAAQVKLFQVDAFTDSLFGGNPAAVCVLDTWPSKEVLQQIASENFLPETAFLVPLEEEDHFDLKWFTPDIEMDLCGHATLASAHVLFNHLDYKNEKITFHSNSGELIVTKKDGRIALDFPSRMPVRAVLPELIERGLGVKPLEVWKARDYIAVYEHEDIIRDFSPVRSILDQINLDPGGIIITAKGQQEDFVSRFFTPQASIFEDPVTGSAHCSLIPLWKEKTGKQKMIARQLSKRGGKLWCEDHGDRVLISGEARTFLEGHIDLNL
ncbi:MAG TPA: PhzF family phenazine biosynthesis protein [Chryseosolibacter sp.]